MASFSLRKHLNPVLLENGMTLGELDHARELHFNAIICNQFSMCQKSDDSLKLVCYVVFFF